MKVYALVGKSGTGKSFQAMNVCRQNNIETLIDDGLFIAGNTVVAGISAKRQQTKVGAIKTALFKNPEHRETVARAIKRLDPASILVIATSDRMAEQICEAVGLPPVSETIYIEDITTEEERAQADYSRNNLGKHVIPAPTFQIKQQFSGKMLETFKNLVGWGPKAVTAEKTVVRPTYSYLGDFEINPKAVEALIRHSAEDIDGVASLGRVGVENTPTGIVIHAVVTLIYGTHVQMVGRRIQQQISTRVAMMTDFNIDGVNLDIRFSR